MSFQGHHNFDYSKNRITKTDVRHEQEEKEKWSRDDKLQSPPIPDKVCDDSKKHVGEGEENLDGNTGQRPPFWSYKLNTCNNDILIIYIQKKKDVKCIPFHHTFSNAPYIFFFLVV